MPDHTPKSYFEEKIAQKLKDKPETSKAVNSVYEFNITGDNGASAGSRHSHCITRSRAIAGSAGLLAGRGNAGDAAGRDCAGTRACGAARRMSAAP